MNKWLALAVAGLALLVGAVLFIPGNILESPANRALSGIGQFSVTSGSIWSGSGKLSLAARSGPPLALDVSWQFDPASLAQLRLGHRLTLRGPEVNGSVRAGIGFSSLALRDADLTTSLATVLRVSGSSTVVSIAQPSAQLRIAQPNGALTIASAAPHAINGNVTLGARDFAIRTLGTQPLGGFDANIEFKNSLGQYQLANGSGRVKIDGSGRVDLASAPGSRAFQFAGTLTPSAPLPLSLQMALVAFGRSTGDGRIRVDYNSRF